MVRTQTLFVLDTNVLMHDPNAIFKFEEHDVFLPMAVMEELDDHKKGNSEVARNVRETTRNLVALIDGESHADILKGIPISKVAPKIEGLEFGKIYFQSHSYESTLPSDVSRFKADTHILGTTRDLQERFPSHQITLVTKDINMRIKAGMLGIYSEDYQNDQVLEDVDLLYTGIEYLDDEFFENSDTQVKSWKEEHTTVYEITSPEVEKWFPGLCLHCEGHGNFNAIVREVNGHTARLEYSFDFQKRQSVWGIHAKNLEQNFALNLLLHPDIDFVTLLGVAGTGKTILTLAAALDMAIEMNLYDEIIVTRATIPVGEDIGFLPGTEEEKMEPWMGAIVDNLEMLMGLDKANDWEKSATNDILHQKIKVKSMSFMRGRSFINKLVIIDEAQNLTAKQMKTLITRAGEGTKIICLGNISQIDSPYLTETTSGLTYAVDRFKNWNHSAHITLIDSVRSRLAEFASSHL